MIPYARHTIEEDDISAVAESLRSGWLTTGPLLEKFEQAVAQRCGARFGVAVSNGTAALHAAMHALGIGPGDEVIVPAITFAATANAVEYLGGTPVYCDVEPDTLRMDPAALEARITPRTKAVTAMDYAGQPCDYDALQAMADKHGLALVADACHSLGGSYKGRPVGSLARMSVLSFHPAKAMTTGEGGMVLTDDPDLARSLRSFRNHGIDLDAGQRQERKTWRYAMTSLGCNYRLTEMQCALGLSQLGKLDRFLARRREIAARYDQAFRGMEHVRPLRTAPDLEHAHHIYVVRADFTGLGTDRDEAFQRFLDAGVGVNVHYLPVYQHPYHAARWGERIGLCPEAEAAYEQILTLPLHPGMDDADVDAVIHAVQTILAPEAPVSHHAVTQSLRDELDRMDPAEAQRLNDALKAHAYFSRSLHSHSLPTVWDWETTNVCAMRCTHCPRTYKMSRPQGHMDMGLFSSILDQIRPYSQSIHTEPAVAKFIHYGEPLLYKHLEESLKLSHERGYSTVISTTAAMLADPERRRIVTEHLDSLWVIVDGLDDETFMRVRGPKASYTEGVAGLEALLEMREARGSETPRVHVFMIKHPYNRHQWGEFEARFGPRQDFTAILAHFSDFNGSVEEINRFRLEMLDDPGEAAEAARAAELNRHTCFYPWHSVSVLWDGRVVPCCRDVNAEYVLGDLNKESLLSIWNGEPIKRLRKEMLSGKRLNPLCAACREGSLEPGLPDWKGYAAQRVRVTDLLRRVLAGQVAAEVNVEVAS